MEYNTEKYQQTLFLETIRTGKTPKRSGLGNRLTLLAGYTSAMLCTLKSNIKLPAGHIAEKLGKTNKLEYFKRSWCFRNSKEIYATEQLLSLKMKNTFTKYLGENIVQVGVSYINVFYKNDAVIDWGLLDEDLKKMYPNNCRIDKRGFVYYKK